MQRIFVTGISTEVGKTIVSAIITQALEADYWKPIQSGDLDYTDSHKVNALISNTKTVIHPSSYELHTPMSPHAAAKIDDVHIDLAAIQEPKTDNHLVIEGAGGLLVPLNNKDTIVDLIKPNYKVVVVSRHYLGSINHTLLTVNLLQQMGCDVAIVFSGNAHESTETIILDKTGLRSLGRINEEKIFNKDVIDTYAGTLRPALLAL